METSSSASISSESASFKSYYVVWKHGMSSVKRTHNCPFKSYYVVWKLQRQSRCYFDRSCLNRTMQYGNCVQQNFCRLEISFKSYYVVWKPVWILCPHSHFLCLNRTMQYGNWCKKRYNPTAIAFKSYYVVWKLVIPSSATENTGQV